MFQHFAAFVLRSVIGITKGVFIMIPKKFNDGWKFWLDKNAFALVWNIPEQAKNITLPHDAMIEERAYAESRNGGNTGFRDGGVYNYVKSFDVPFEYKEKTVMLKFEGIYMNAFVYVNEELAAKCPYGYTGFYVNLNEYLCYGQINEIRVVVRNSAMTNSRWYSGGGIYRDVYLLVSDTAYIQPENVQITTESVSENMAVLSTRTILMNRRYSNADVRLRTEILDATGKVEASDEVPVTLFEHKELLMRSRMAIDNPKLWSENTPDLYTCHSSLIEDGKVIDEEMTIFGIRILSVNAKQGLCVNGTSIKLRGACIHHDSGLLGTATFYDAQYRQVRILKEAGFNAIRMSHHPMAPAMLRACDELGMYVMDETFDMWNRCKSDNDYGLFFGEWWEKDTEAMVRKDYNHPSVILYSVGNEIPEIGTNHGAKICHDICEKIKSMDTTRFTLASINGVFAAGDKIPSIMEDLAASGAIDGNVNDFMTVMDTKMDQIVVHKAISERLEKACTMTDVAGYNYMTARYEGDGRTYPNRVIVGSETYPPEIARNWSEVKKWNHVIGDFTWTGWDYIGEAGVGIPAYNWGEGGFGAVFPCQLAYSGDIDITGFRRPASYFREIVFGLRKAPYITVQNPYQYGKQLIKTPWVISDSMSSWTYPHWEGKSVIVEIYAAGDEVELFCNDISLGKKKAGEEVGFITYFETTYHPGTLKAVSYEKGIKIGSMDLATAGSDTGLSLTAEEGIMHELVYLTITSQDAAGIIDTAHEVKLRAVVTGGAKRIGFGSANPKPVYEYTADETETFHGMAQLVLQRTDLKEKVEVTVYSENEKSQTSIRL